MKPLLPAAGFAAAAALAFGVVIPATAAPAPLPTITATMVSGKTLKLTGDTGLTPGRVRIILHTLGGGQDGGDLALIRLHPGYSFKDFVSDLKKFNANFGQNGPNKKAIKAVDHAYNNVNGYGGIGLDSKKTGQETVVLTAGTYLAYNDTGNLPANPVTFTVSGPVRHATAPKSSATIIVRNNSFGGAKVLPASGTITVVNRGSKREKNEAILLHVKQGTTIKQIEKYFLSGSQKEPSFGRPGSISTDIIDSGRSQTLTYSVPRGEYVELSFAPDYKTGIPHAYTGMLKLLQLK